MKRTSLFILLLVFTGISSCRKEVLNLSPETSVTTATFYKTADQFDQALVGSYQNMRSIAEYGMIMD